jgi:hypothetical protein
LIGQPHPSQTRNAPALVAPQVERTTQWEEAAGPWLGWTLSFSCIGTLYTDSSGDFSGATIQTSRADVWMSGVALWLA